VIKVCVCTVNYIIFGIEMIHLFLFDLRIVRRTNYSYYLFNS